MMQTSHGFLMQQERQSLLVIVFISFPIRTAFAQRISFLSEKGYIECMT